MRIASDYRGSAIQQLNRRYTSILIKMVDDAVANGEIPQAIDPRVVRDMMFGAIEHSAWRACASAAVRSTCRGSREP